MRYALLIIAFFVMSVGRARIPGPPKLSPVYFDTKGAFLRHIIEGPQVDDFEDKAISISNEYNPTLLTTGIEMLARTGLSLPSHARINFSDYKDVGKYYLNPFTRRAFRRKIDYIKGAYDLVSYLSLIGASNQVDRGVEELIGEKYIDIVNTLLGELEALEREDRKNTYIRRNVLGLIGK